MVKTDFDVIIVGGGLAGLTSAILLSKNNISVLLIEKKNYPFHKVCGEYVSNEILLFLKSIDFNPFDFGAIKISKLRVSTPSGKNINAKLDLCGFGLSRFTMDNALYEIAKNNGAQILTSTKVVNISFQENVFQVETNSGEKFSPKLVIGSWGKRDAMDKKLNRDFIQSRTGYLGVKYHIKTDYPSDEIGLDNFENGYCGISKIENEEYNMCYLYNRNTRQNFKTIPELEENILFKNPIIKNRFKNSTFIFSEPEVINEISFAPKKRIEDHILICGDSAGLITPLCGNGMAMAIHGAKLLSELILNSKILSGNEISISSRKDLENEYEKTWKANFSRRLFWGRTIQKFFGNPGTTEFVLKSIHTIPLLENYLIRQTHGKEIN
jgi:menaquinone-9 beta-reductase